MHHPGEPKRNRQQAEAERQLAQVRNEADTLIYQAEKSLSSLGDKVPANDRAAIDEQIQALKQAAAGEDTDQIRSLLSALQNATYALSQQANAADTSAANGGSYHGGSAAGNEQSGSEDVVEGDFTEV